MKTNIKHLLSIIGAFLLGASAHAALPFSFSSGQVIKASEMNTNFSALQSADAALQSQIDNLSWSNLRNVPAGFADGVDDGNVYSAGSGLSLSGTTFSLNGSSPVNFNTITAGTLSANTISANSISCTGGVKVGYSSTADSASAGTLRYNAGQLQFSNGSQWRTINSF